MRRRRRDARVATTGPSVAMMAPSKSPIALTVTHAACSLVFLVDVLGPPCSSSFSRA